MRPLLTKSQIAKNQLSFTTDYGLALNIHTDNLLSAHSIKDIHVSATSNISDPESNSNLTNPKFNSTAADTEEPRSTNLGYQYYIWPDYGTTFVFYTAGWDGNLGLVDDLEIDELESRYSPSWCNGAGGLGGQNTLLALKHESVALEVRRNLS